MYIAKHHLRGCGRGLHWWGDVAGSWRAVLGRGGGESAGGAAVCAVSRWHEGWWWLLRAVLRWRGGSAESCATWRGLGVLCWVGVAAAWRVGGVVRVVLRQHGGLAVAGCCVPYWGGVVRGGSSRVVSVAMRRVRGAVVAEAELVVVGWGLACRDGMASGRGFRAAQYWWWRLMETGPRGSCGDVACEKRYGKKKENRILELGLRVATAWRRGGDFAWQGAGGGKLEAKDGGGGYGSATEKRLGIVGDEMHEVAPVSLQ
ncbi:hypothetical protein EDB85DRAFT_1900231 [Lactarius pseudohatsudake]|nr:hypothetical protein EDB85DRAFT_1900231 [Lactarius pseudohatsudake]